MNPRLDLTFGESGAREQPLLLDLRFAGHNNNFVVILVRAGFDHERGIDDGDACRIDQFHFRQPLLLTPNHGWMHQAVEFGPRP